VLMPVVFLFSAIVSGIALVLVIYMISSWVRRRPIDMRCLDKLAQFLFYALILDVPGSGFRAQAWGGRVDRHSGRSSPSVRSSCGRAGDLGAGRAHGVQARRRISRPERCCSWPYSS
jgi:hypothetical protein